MKNKLFEESQYKKTYQKFLTWMLILSAGYALVINPLTLKSNTHVLLQRTMVPSLLDLVGQIWLYLIFWLAFAFVLYSVSRVGLQSSKKIVWAFIGFSVFRPVVGYLMTYWIGYQAFQVEDLYESLVSIALDSLQMILVTWVVVSTEKKLLNQHKLTHYLPIPKLFATKTPVTPLIGKMAVLPAVIKMITRLIFDLYNIIALNELLDSWDFLWMFLGYFSDILFALIGYMVIVLMVNSVSLADERAQIEFEEAEAQRAKQIQKKSLSNNKKKS